MSTALEDLRAAEAQSKASRERLTGTLVLLQRRLTPKALMQEAADDLKEKAAEWAHETLDAIKARPATTAGFLAGVVLLLFRDDAWKALAGFFRRETEMDDDELNDRMIGESTG